MGKKDVISKIYLGEADRIADLLNNELFEGSKVVEASDIMERDSVAAETWKEEGHIVNVRVAAKDLVRNVRFGMQVMPEAYKPMSVIITPSGGFLTLGILLLIVNAIVKYIGKHKQMKARGEIA